MKTQACQNECNRDRIHDFLNGDADRPDTFLTEQLEECAACRAYFDLHVASDDEWSHVGQLLQPGEYDVATKIDFSAGSDAGRQARQSVSINEVIESLAPTDDPHSLGRIGKYEVNGVIGAGGMGVVLKAFEPSLDRVVAIKVLSPHLANNHKARQRFEREARAAAAVINPNVIPIYSVANDGKLPYLVMACIQGGSLQQRLDAEGAASVPEVLRIGSQIASGLAAAHEQGLVHRDIKPENILFEGDVERVSLTDFGLARAVDDNTVTQAGTIAGTPMYMSPEQARGEQVDQQSDLFSLGSVLYAMCTGQPPYCADSSLGVMRKITDESPAPIRELNAETPEWLSDIIKKLMARDKADRFASAAEVHEVLEACLSHVQQPTASPLPASLKRTSQSIGRGLLTKLGLAAVLAFGLLFACSLFIALSLQRHDSSQDRVFKPLSAIDGYIHTMLMQAKSPPPDSAFLNLGQLGESGGFLTLRAMEGGIQIDCTASDQALFTNRQGKFFERIREVAEALSVPVTERSQLDQNGNVESVVLTLTFSGGPHEVTTNITQLITQVFGIDRTTVCKFGFSNMPGLSGKLEPGPKLVSRKEFMAALDSGYLYAGELLNTIYIGPAEATAQRYVPWNESIFWIHVSDLQEQELSIARFGKAHRDGIEKSNVNAAGVAIEKAPAFLTDLSDADLALIYQQITGADLASGFISGSDLASSVNILLKNDKISTDQIAKKLVDLGKPDVAKVVLSATRVDPSAAEALKLGDLLLESGEGARAIDAYLEAYRIAPMLFDWEKIDTFDEHDRLKDLAEVFTEERIRKTRSGTVSNMHYLLKTLMKKEDLRTSVGMPLMDRLWKARPDMRIWVFDETKWNEVPNRADYFADVLIPKDIENVGNGWGAMYGDVQGGWLSELQKVLDEPTTRELIDRIKPNVEEHENWLAGAAMLAVLEALNGNCEPAKRILEDKENTAGMTWYHKGYLGLSLQGKDRELDGQIIKLYEASLEQRSPKSPYRASRVHELAKLYHKFERKQDALDLMYGLAERDRKVDEFLVENWGRAKTVNLDHERIWDLRTAVKTLNSIGYPLDSLLLLSRVTFEQRRAAGVYKGGGWEYNDEHVNEASSKSQKLLSTNAIVEALNRGVIPIGLTSTIDKESGEIDNPIVELLAQVARKELSAEASAAFESVNATLADVDAMDQHLSDLMKQHPTDVDIVVSAAIFAFLRVDIETAKERLEVVDSITGTDHKASASDVNLHLAAAHAMSHEATTEIGERLAIRAAESGKQMNDEWKQFFAPPARRQKSATAMPIKQRIKKELNADELCQLTDELLEIYRDGPGGLPRDQIGGDKLVFNAFKKAGRLVELGECIGETAEESGASDLVTARETIEALMNDAETRPLAYRTLEKVFKVSHDVRSQSLSFPQGFGVDWKTAPNFIVYLRATLLPANLTRYQRPFSKSLFSQQKALHEFTDEVRASTGKPKSRNGRLGALLLLAVLESEIGNLEAAEKIINEQFIGPDGPTLGSENAMTLAYGIVGKNESLDRLAMKLWESKISVQRDGLSYRPLPDLAKLYGKYGRREEARQLLYGLVSPTNQHPLLKGYRPGIKTSCRRYHEQKCSSCHQGETNLTDYTVLSDGLMDLGYPVDSYISLARIDDSFRNIYSSTKGWLELTPDEKTYDRLVEYRNESRDYLFKRRVTLASQKVTPGSVIEALRLGTVEKSPRYTKESYEALRTPISRKQKRTLELEEATDDAIDLMLSVRGVGPEAKATVFSPVIEVLKLAADFEGERAEEDKDRLDALLRLKAEVNPRDVQAAVASTAFAFLRNDLETATERLNALERIELTNDAKAQRANACLWLVARYGLAHDSTRSLGKSIAEKAITAATGLPKTRIKEAIHREQMEILSRH